MARYNIRGSSRWPVVALFLVILTSAGAGMVILVSQRGSARTIRNLSTAFVEEVATRAQEATLSYLGAGPRSLETIRSLVRGGAIDPADAAAPEILARQFRSLLQAHGEIEMLNFGRPDGDFMMVKRMPDGSLSTKRVRRRGSLAESTWEHDNDAWSHHKPYADRREPAEEAYDPRPRPWYRLAAESGELGWIDPYIYYSDRMPGIGCTLPLYDRGGDLVGVVSADIGIADLSRLLADFRIGRSGTAVILTAAGRVIAYPGFASGLEIAREVGGSSGPEPVLQRVVDLPDPVLAAAFHQRPPGNGGTAAEPFTFDHDGTGYVARFELFPLSSERRWIVGVVAPQEDFMGSVRRDQAVTLGVMLACLVLAIGVAATLVLRAARLEIELLGLRTVEMQGLIDDLEAKNAEMERFTYTASHDLKSPLITIRGFLGMLERDLAAGREDRAKKDIRRIHSATGRMARLLDELLQLSRIGRLVNPTQEIAIGELAREAADQLAGPLAERGVELKIADDFPIVRGDRSRILEVVQNLIENAVKFLGDHARPRIEVGVRRDGATGEPPEANPPEAAPPNAAPSETVFYVRDNGIGIDPRYHEKIFGLFERLDQEIDGTGIGLALVKRIVELHGGRIWVESEGRERGSAFCFTLPPKS